MDILNILTDKNLLVTTDSSGLHMQLGNTGYQLNISNSGVVSGSYNKPIDPMMTRITTVEDGAQEFSIEGGTLDRDFLASNGFYDNFDWIKTITSVDIGTNVNTIDANVFYGCGSLTSVTIPASVEWIGDGAFSECNGLTNVTFLGKTMQQVQDIENDYGDNSYPFGLKSGTIIHCTDGDVTVP